MRIASVNVSMPQEVLMDGRGHVLTAIYKQPVSGPVMVRRLNLDGDLQGDPVNHGGPDQAVYAYTLEDYAYWETVLGREFPAHGWFGENLTMEGATSADVYISDVLQAGGALLQVTGPRVPCYKLEHKMGIPGFAHTFMESARTGFYLRVLEKGPVEAGDEVTLVRRDPNSVSVSRMSDIYNFGQANADEMERVLCIEGLAEGLRVRIGGWLSRKRGVA